MTLPFGPNWAVFLLPYVEQDNLYKLANPDSYPGISPVPLYGDRGPTPKILSGINTSWRVLRGATVPIYQCPSDGNNQTPFNDPAQVPETNWARGNYAANAG